MCTPETEVLAKAGRDIGATCRSLLLDDLCQRLDYVLDDPATRRAALARLALAEARRAKEAVYFQDQGDLRAGVPREFRRFEARRRRQAIAIELRRDDLARLLESAACTGASMAASPCARQAVGRGVGEAEIDDVLMVAARPVPGVYRFRGSFGRRARVRAWQPFEAGGLRRLRVRRGARRPADFIVHDYALLTYDLKTSSPSTP